MKSAIFDKNKAYAYVSYNKADAPLVEKDIAELIGRGVNIWYDGLLPAGENWDYVAKPILVAPNCKLLIFYATAEAIANKNTQKELNLAWKFKKNILPIKASDMDFVDLIQTEIINNEKYAAGGMYDVSAAIDLVMNCLGDALRYVPQKRDDYYEAIMNFVRHMAPDIASDIGGTPAPLEAQISDSHVDAGPFEQTLAKTVTFSLYGQKYEDYRQADFLLKVYEDVLAKHSDQLDSAIVKINEGRKTQIGPVGDELRTPGKIVAAGRELYVECNHNPATKLAKIKELFEAVGEDANVLEIAAG